MKYNFLNPIFDEIDEIVRKHVNNHNEKFKEYDVHCSLRLLTTTNHVKKRIKPQSSLHYSIYISEKLFLSKISHYRYHFSQIIEKTVTFVSCIRHMTYEHHTKKLMPMGEIRLIRILSGNPD